MQNLFRTPKTHPIRTQPLKTIKTKQINSIPILIPLSHFFYILIVNRLRTLLFCSRRTENLNINPEGRRWWCSTALSSLGRSARAEDAAGPFRFIIHEVSSVAVAVLFSLRVRLLLLLLLHLQGVGCTPWKGLPAARRDRR